MSAVLNIGYVDFANDPIDICEAADEVGLIVMRFEHADQCFVVEVEGDCFDDYPDDTLERVFDLVAATGRECIAAYQKGCGYMVGPGRDKYGPFDYSKFKDFA